MTRIILALCALLSGLLYLALGVPEDWRGQGAAGCLFHDGAGALQMECRP